jgi:hypothetical protein
MAVSVGGTDRGEVGATGDEKILVKTRLIRCSKKGLLQRALIRYRATEKSDSNIDADDIIARRCAEMRMETNAHERDVSSVGDEGRTS